MPNINKKTGLITSDNGYKIKFGSHSIGVVTNDGFEFCLSTEIVDSGRKVIIYDDTKLKISNIPREHIEHTIETLRALNINVEVE